MNISVIVHTGSDKYVHLYLCKYVVYPNSGM